MDSQEARSRTLSRLVAGVEEHNKAGTRGNGTDGISTTDRPYSRGNLKGEKTSGMRATENFGMYREEEEIFMGIYSAQGSLAGMSMISRQGMGQKANDSCDLNRGDST